MDAELPRCRRRAAIGVGAPLRLSIPTRLLIAMMLVLPLALSGNLPARAEVGDLTSLTLTPLAPGNDAITRVGVQRGRGMERESLGLAVSAGTVIEARVTNAVDDVKLSLMTDNHETDVESGNGYQPGVTLLPTNGAWQRVTAVAPSGVFVRTKAWNQAPQIEYRVVSGPVFAMPTYRLGDSKPQFISTWRSSNSPFAIVVDASFTMLVPRLDLDKVSDMTWSHFADLDDVISFYRKLMSTYDGWLGVSDADPNPLHKNLAQAPFMRPDKTGWGLAYYSGGNYIGTNVGSVDYYLAGPESWLILHEVGHGYDGIMTNTSGPGDIQLGEVWNNVYGYQYQTLVNPPSPSNWLNATSKPVDQKRRDDDRRRSGSWQFNQLGYQDKLDFVVRIADLTGPAGFTTFNRSLRELQATPGFRTWPARKDLIAQNWGGAQGHNLSPWFDAYSLPLTASTQESLYDVQQLPIAMPLSDLFADASRAQAAATQLGLDSSGALVSSTRTATLGTAGSIRVTAATTTPADIEGRIVSLFRGAIEVSTAPFRNGVANFTGIPLGAYTMRFPLSHATGVVPNRQWVAARQSPTPTALTVAYPASAPAPSLDDSVLTLRGLGDTAFATVQHDGGASTLTINDTLLAPHSYFPPPRAYANISVDAGSQRLFERSFIGTEKRTAAPITTIPAVLGTTVTITHLEPSRVVATNPVTGASRPSLDTGEVATTWRVTAHGLVKLDNDGHGDDQAGARDHLASMESALSELAATVADHPGARLEATAASLRIAIDQLTNSADRQALSSQYGAVLAAQIGLADRPSSTPTPTPTPTPSVSPTPTPTPTPTPSVSPTPTPTPTPTPSLTPSVSPTPSVTPTPSVSPTRSVTPTPSVSVSPSVSTSVLPTQTSTTTTKPTTTTAPTKTTTTTTRPTVPAPFDVYTTPGYHTVNGRQWFTACEAYSRTTRCRTEIWATQIHNVGGKFVQKTGWQFNNLTYLPSARSLWKSNPLGYTNSWIASDGRQWRTECDTPLTGRNGCRSWSVAKVVQSTPARGGGVTYKVEAMEVFNNIVRFS